MTTLQPALGLAEIVELGMKSILGGTLATWCTGAVVGIITA